MSDVEIRAATPADAPALLDIYRPVVERTAISFEVVAPSVDEFAARIRAALEEHAWLVATRDGRVAGYAYGTAHRARAAYRFSTETTVYVDADHRRAGVGRALYESLFVALAARGLHRAYAGIALPNDGSVGLHRAVGFTPVGVFAEVGWKFDRWHDVSWWQRPLGGGSAARDDSSPVPRW